MNMGSKIGKHDDTPAREAGHVSPVSLTSVNAAVEGRDGESEKGTDKSPHDLWRNDDHYAGSPASSKSPSRAAKHGASGGTEELGISPEAEYSKRKRSMQHIAQNVVLEDYVRGMKTKHGASPLILRFIRPGVIPLLTFQMFTSFMRSILGTFWAPAAPVLCIHARGYL
jgi:hypothetical protein